LNYEGIRKVTLFVARVAERLATDERALTFVKLKDKAPAAGRGYGVYLGTVPRFGTTDPGVEIDGVRSGSPAELAGLRQGDVIRQLATFKVDSLEDLTRALRSLKPEDVVDVVVERTADGKKTTLRLRATLKKRGP
jgi:S1-C subfamily serine protease